MERFIGRERELNALSELYGSDGFQLVTVCGRRRVGKTSLIKGVHGRQKGVYYQAVRSKGDENPRRMAAAVRRQLGVTADVRRPVRGRR